MKKVLGIGCLTLFLLFVISVAIGTVFLFKVELASRPTIEFKQPLQDQIIGMDDTLVRFIAWDTVGIEHVELWVDGALIASRKSSLAEGSNPFPFTEMWYPQSTGAHTLTARAYNSENREAVVSVVVQVSEQPEEQPQNLAEIGNMGSSAPEPENEIYNGETAGSADLIDAEIPIMPLEGYVSEIENPLFDFLTPAKLGGIFKFGTILQVEALTLETDRTYDGVFCYISLADMPVERIPGDGFIDSQEGNFWDIRALLGSDNRRTIIMGESELLSVMLNCWGAIFDAGAVYELGTVHMVHPVEDWNGEVIDQHADGPSGWFNVSYRIYPLGGGGEGGGGEELPPPALTYNCYESPFIDYCDLNIEYPNENRTKIDGFVFIRDGTFFTYVPNRLAESITINDIYGTLPTCSQTDVYQVVAYQGDYVVGERSLFSNAISITGDPCYKWVQVRFDYINTTCLTGDSALDTCSSRGSPGDTELSYYDNDYEDSYGCSFANLWANDENIDVGYSDNWGCYWWSSGGLYKVSDIYDVETDTVVVFLSRMDSLIIGMNVYDYDIGYDDKQCYGEYIYYPQDLEEIAKLPDKTKTYTRNFSESGGGRCKMQYTITILPWM